MNEAQSAYPDHLFPHEIVSHTVWLYFQWNLSFPDVEDLLAKRGFIVSCVTIQQWHMKFDCEYAHKLNRKQAGWATPGAWTRCL